MTDQTNKAAAQGNNAQPQQQYTVFDSNQRGALPRIHEVIIRMPAKGEGGEPETKSYELFSSSEKPCQMVRDHAFKFLTDGAFRVYKPDGTRIMPVEKFDPSRPLTELRDDEIVVKYNELSKEALLRRVKVLPGSEDIPLNALPVELADFLVQYRKSLRGMTEGDRAIAERIASTGMESISGEGLDRMLGERKAA